MSELHQATIEWSGDAALGTTLLAAASRPGCNAKLTESEGISHLTIVVEKIHLSKTYEIGWMN